MGVFDFSDGQNWSCGVFSQMFPDPQTGGTLNWCSLFVMEDLGKTPLYKKIPGGRRRNGDRDIRDTAVREFYEETGVLIPRERLVLVDSEPRRGHVYHLFRTILEPSEFYAHFRVGKHGERVFEVSATDMLREDDEFLPYHRELLERNNLWPIPM